MNTQTTPIDQSKVKPKAPKIEELISQCKSIMLATLNEDGTPLVSNAPYARVNGSFQVLVSFMAKHTKNLINQKKVSYMFVEDESVSKQLYARHRLTIDTEAQLVDKDSELYQEAIQDLKDRHGKVIDVLSGLDDFVLIDLKPIQGSYVNGFGSAYYVDSNLQIVEHRKGAHGKHNVEESENA